MANLTKYISQLSDEELEEMLFSYLKEEFYKYHSSVCVLTKEDFGYRKDNDGLPTIYQLERPDRGMPMQAQLSDYEASVRLHLVPEDVSNKHRSYMFGRFGAEYLYDLGVTLKSPLQLKLDEIDRLLEQISTEEPFVK